MKRFLFLTILYFLLPLSCKAATEFVSIVDTGGATDSDYSTLSSWEGAIGTNLTAPSTIVFSGIVTGTAPADGAQVTLYRSGASQGVGATVVHTAKTNTQILLKNVSDSGYAWAADDQWRVNDTNYFQIDDVTHDQPQITAKCRATTGAADTTAVTISGWDTDSTHFIKIWTDPSENYRHQGKWDVGKYRLEVSASASTLIDLEEYSQIIGLQISNTYATSSKTIDFDTIAETTNSNLVVSQNIIKGGTLAGIWACKNDNFYIYNNIIYGANYGIYLYRAKGAYTPEWRVYNNTVYNCTAGIRTYTEGTAVIKNNLIYNNTDNYYGTFDASSTNNLSGPSADSDIAGQSNPQNGVTVTFADEYNNDFHLDSADTGAKNQGTILYDSGDDSNLNFTTDADNEARKDSAGTWDIGADENVAKIYRSVGVGATSPLASGGTADSSYGNMEIKPTYLNVGSTANLTDYIATFWRPLPDNVGVGDALQYDADNTGGIDNIVFITERIDSTHYSVRKSDGTAPTSTSSVPNNTWSIYRSYISLSNAEAGTENTGITAGVRDFDTGNVDLTTNNLQWNIACYANGTAADTSKMDITGWTFAADNYMRVYTPTRTDEVGTTQRHQGKFDTSKFWLDDIAYSNYIIYSALDYIRVEGLQFKFDSSQNNGATAVSFNYIDSDSDIRVGDNIFWGSSSSLVVAGLNLNGGANPGQNGKFRVYNNIIYDFMTSAGSGAGITTGTYGTRYIYNNTLYGNRAGINIGNTNDILYNNIANGNTYDYSGTPNSASDFNISEDGSASFNATFFGTSKAVTFADETNRDLHLGVGETNARNTGKDLTNDLYLPIQTDIDSSGSTDGKSCEAVYQDSCLTRPRSTSWDIGADELITKIYRSVGIGTTAAIISGTSPAISLTISGNTGTFSTFPTSADFGVGDVIRYDSDNNGTVDSTAFISAIDSTAKTATLQNSTGGTAPQMAVGDYDWKLYRAYTSLSNWEAGTENTGIGVTYDAGNRDIATNSEQWNVACYANSGTVPDTTATTINGWTTAEQNYIKIYTPTSTSEVTTNQRHQGKWDGTKYNLLTSGQYDINLDITANHVYIDGLQLGNTHTDYRRYNIQVNNLGGVSSNVRISKNIIISSNITSTVAYGIQLAGNSGKIWNNIMYGGWYFGIYISSSSANNWYVYNNTIVPNAASVGIWLRYGSGHIAKNNIVQNTTTGYQEGYAGNFDPSSDYNISDHDDAPGTHSKNSTTVSFVDSTNKDFHLATTDTAAKDSGTDLSKDLYLPITSDIDSQSRNSNFKLKISNSQYDIGADQSANAIYRSLAPSATSSIASGTSPANSMIIAGTSVTFGTAPGDMIGVGDVIQYDSDNNGTVDSIAFISARQSSTVYTIQDRTGASPVPTSATDYDWSIFRAYTSLQNASGSSTGGTENTGLSDNIEHFDIDWAASHGKNIYTANQQWNIAAYANSTTADSTATTISGWTTYPTNYLKVYTPYATTEVGTSQRHQGKWDSSKYNISTSNQWYGTIRNSINYARFSGLQIENTADPVTGDPVGIRALNGKDLRISECIIKHTHANAHSYNTQAGITLDDIASNSNVSIWNNIIYDYGSGIFYDWGRSGMVFSIYNNTIYNTLFQGIRMDGYAGYVSLYLKNNISVNNVDDYYIADFATKSYSNNLGEDAAFTGDSNYVQITQSMSNFFADSANKDFHLGNSSVARNSGADLSADAYLPITTDIDGHTRPTGTNVVDIGADEGATAIYYSVGQSTSTDFKVASNVSVSGYTATFTTAQTGNMGVGDIVTYTGGSCYITGKTSTSVWSCQNATGGTAPQVTGVSVTSIKRAFASLNSSIGGSTAPEFLNTSDLKTNNYILNIPCYMDSGTTPDTTKVTISGFNTAQPNYIKIYTPNNTSTEANQSQRHQGKWDDTKYYLNVPEDVGTIRGAIYINVQNVRIDGIQINRTVNSYSAVNGIDFASLESGEFYISNSIIKSINTGSWYNYGIYYNKGSTGSAIVNVWNNILYGWSNSNNNSEGIYLGGYGNFYVYNNTVLDSDLGMYTSQQSGRIALFRNNIAQGCDDGYGGVFNSSSDYNISNLASDAPSPSYRNNLATAVTFQDSTNKDFHLGIGDTGARNQGINIGTGSTEPYLVLSTDIDGNTRNTDSRGYDIGADEGATAIYYSVGQSSSDLKTGSPTLSIDSSGNGTLSVSQTGNMGVGDYIEYGTSPYNKAYITGKTSTTVWTVQAANGTMLGVATTEPVNSIKHAYTTLNSAIAGASGSTMMNTTDLYTNNYQLNVPCYYDSAADTTATTISGYTTYSMNYIKVYTPTNISTEANNSQRHQGKWDDGKYVLSPSVDWVMFNWIGYIRIDGLQITTSYAGALDFIGSFGNYGNKGGDIQISNNIIKGNGGPYNQNGIQMYNYGGNEVYKIWNNIIYNSGGNYDFGISINASNLGRTAYVYNNLVSDYSFTYVRANDTYIAKNNISRNSSNGFYGTFDSASDYNISDLASDAPSASYRNDLATTVNFVDSANYDFHLAENDTSARNAGADLSTDTNLAVTTDIDGNSRPTQNAFDIGADEGATYIYYSVGQNTNDHKTGSPNITLSGYSATLDVAQTAPNMGVGDLITYTGGSCYITAKTNDDKMHWNCQNATGGTAVQVSGVSVTSIAHAFSSLGGDSDSAALSSNTGQGVRNSSHLNTSDLYAGNYILNIPCYYDTGADTSWVNIQLFTTSASNYMKVYAPNNISDEVNQTQRHSGKWDDGKYKLERTISSGGAIIESYPNNIRFEGLQIKVSNGSAISTYGISVDAYGASSRTSDIRIYDNIIKAGSLQSGSYSIVAINGAGTGASSNRQYIWNNIIYDFNNGTTGYGIYNYADSGYAKTQYVYNNTIYNCYRGIALFSNSNTIAKNNIVQGATDGYYGTFASGSDYNISNVSSDTTGGAHDKDNTTVTFADSNNDDFHLSGNDTSAKNVGTNLSSDSYLPITEDIDGQDRGGWCIGADEIVDIMNTTKGTVRTKGNVRFK